MMRMEFDIITIEEDKRYFAVQWNINKKCFNIIYSDALTSDHLVGRREVKPILI